MGGRPSRRDLERRIAALEAQVQLLSLLAQQTEPYRVTMPTTTPWYPQTYPQITCSASMPDDHDGLRARLRMA